MYGLKYIPTIGDDDRDGPSNAILSKLNIRDEFSLGDHKVMLDALLSIRDKCNVILEIGVARNGGLSSTFTLLGAKKDTCLYVGVDMNDKSFLTKLSFYSNVTTIKTHSSNISTVLDTIEHISGNKTIDFIHIDGWHSVNQVLDDWRFAEYLSEHGIIMLHDTNWHPGPSALIKALDENLFTCSKYYDGDTTDWGVAVIRRA